MIKKLLIILLLFSLAFSAMPKEASCDDLQRTEAATHQDCSTMCHACSSAVLPVRASVFLSIKATNADSIQGFSYQDPSLDTLKRPPVVLA